MSGPVGMKKVKNKKRTQTRGVIFHRLHILRVGQLRGPPQDEELPFETSPSSS